MLKPQWLTKLQPDAHWFAALLDFLNNHLKQCDGHCIASVQNETKIS